MPRSTGDLRRDALQVWRAGVEAVRSERLVRQALRVEDSALVVGDDRLELGAIRRIAVVGAGKAGAGMAAAVEEILGPRLVEEKQLAGWVNVPADCVRPLRRITLHPARPPGVNEPTSEGMAGTEEILRIVQSLTADDLCLCLISGGGSALMPAPAEGISLEDKLAITRCLSAAGANIEQLNAVRKQLSRIKGGGLARACRAGRLVALIISDVLGDPLDVIASAPTVADTSTPQDAIDVLEQFTGGDGGVVHRMVDYLRQKPQCELPPPTCRVTNLVIGNNATAVEAAGQEAERLGYSPKTTSARQSEGAAEDLGRQLAEAALAMRAGSGPDCVVSGGEPVVSLVDTARRGMGGRNQQLVLAAMIQMAGDAVKGDGGPFRAASTEHRSEPAQTSPVPVTNNAQGIALMSGGTDGEDGPTDAAGAVVDADVVAAAREQQLDAADYLSRNDAYNFFRRVGGLIKTGPTHTNVCDLRVVVVAPSYRN